MPFSFQRWARLSIVLCNGRSDTSENISSMGWEKVFVCAVTVLRDSENLSDAGLSP